MNGPEVQKAKIARESLFNEVKGSLFEFLVAQNLARYHRTEKKFLESIDKNYLNVLTQQDRMVRQFYPELGLFLRDTSAVTVSELSRLLGEVPSRPRLLGKLVNSTPRQDWHEADLILEIKGVDRPVSLKLNKRGAFVNTKSAGIKSFFTQYFPFLPQSYQTSFNQLVDLEFERMSRDLHAIVDLSYPGDFSSWVRSGFSELPGELPDEQRAILKAYYSRLAQSMHETLGEALAMDPNAFKHHLAPLLGFSSPDILQVICFHEFKKETTGAEVFLHETSELLPQLRELQLKPFGDIASVELSIGTWGLQVRIKPMNKFTTTAIKINCSLKIRPSSEA